MRGFWSVENIENWEDLWVVDEPSVPMLTPSREMPDGSTQWLEPITAMLLWMLPMVNVHEINEDNIQDVFICLRMLEYAQGPMIESNGHDLYISLDHLKRRVGLRAEMGMKMGPMEETLLSAVRMRAKEDLKKELID